MAVNIAITYRDQVRYNLELTRGCKVSFEDLVLSAFECENES